MEEGRHQEVADRQREQNRVHARFTRQRKQEIFDKLQSQYQDLLNQQLHSEMKTHEDEALSRMLKQKVIQLLDLWSDAGDRWKDDVDLSEVSDFLDPSVRAVLPECSCRPDSSSRQLVGIENVLSGGVASMSLQQPDELGFPAFKLKFASEVAMDTVFTGSRAAMCPFWYRSFNAVECGASREVELRGMLYCEFNLKNGGTCETSPADSTDENEPSLRRKKESPDALISGAKVVYDCAAWVREVTSAFAWDLPEISKYSPVPINVNQAYAAMAANGSRKAMVLTTLEAPRKIVRVTERHCRMTGHHPRELLGNSMLWLDPSSDDQRSRLTELVTDLVSGCPLTSMMVHPVNVPPTKTEGVSSPSFVYTLTQAFPLTSSPDEGGGGGEYTHCLWVLKDPPEPHLVPCVRSLLELGVRLVSTMRDLPPTNFDDRVYDMLNGLLLRDDSMADNGAPPPIVTDDEEFGMATASLDISEAATPEERYCEEREREVVTSMWELYQHTRELWGKIQDLSPEEKRATRALGATWSEFFSQVREAGAHEPFASFIERARHFSGRGDESVSFILRRFASLALNFHRDWVSGGTINDSVPADKVFEVERAVAVYTKVIETWPEYAQAWNRRARAHFLLGNYQDADSDLEKAIYLTPNNSSAWVGRMLVKMKQQKYADALAAYKQAIKLNSSLDIASQKPPGLENVVDDETTNPSSPPSEQQQQQQQQQVTSM